MYYYKKFAFELVVFIISFLNHIFLYQLNIF